MTESRPAVTTEITADNFVDLLPAARPPLPDPDLTEEPVGGSPEDLSDEEALALAAEDADADDTTTDEAASWALLHGPDGTETES